MKLVLAAKERNIILSSKTPSGKTVTLFVEIPALNRRAAKVLFDEEIGVKRFAFAPVRRIGCRAKWHLSLSRDTANSCIA
jgi:hypothetical protein